MKTRINYISGYFVIYNINTHLQFVECSFVTFPMHILVTHLYCKLIYQILDSPNIAQFVTGSEKLNSRMIFHISFTLFCLISEILAVGIFLFSFEESKLNVLVEFQNNLVEVEIQNGKIAGRKFVSVQNKTIYSFQQIPFARPPVGILRLKV